MPEGWVKLHRQILKNELFVHNKNAMLLFVHLLLIVDKDTGTWSGGRFQLADLCKMTPSNTYKTLMRLKVEQMIDTQSNNKYTTIHICNWNNYQTKSSSKVAAKEQQSNTLTRRRIKNNIDKSILGVTPYGKPEINEMFEYWQQRTGIPISSQIQANRNACNNLIKKHTQDGVRKLIDGVAQSQGDQFAPRIADFVQLQAKLSQLLLWGKQNITSRKVVKI